MCQNKNCFSGSFYLFDFHSLLAHCSAYLCVKIAAVSGGEKGELGLYPQGQQRKADVCMAGFADCP